MKKFKMESRGLLPDSHEYIDIRNRIYADLRREKGAKSESHTSQLIKGKFVQANFSSFFILLIVVPELVECFEAMNMLRFFRIPF